MINKYNLTKQNFLNVAYQSFSSHEFKSTLRVLANLKMTNGPMGNITKPSILLRLE